MGSINRSSVRLSSSLVADENAVDFCKNPKNLEVVYYPDSGVVKKTKELVSLFRLLLESFFDEFCSAYSVRPLPPMTADGRPVDLFSLFINVGHKGGFDAVSENGLWDEIVLESGLGFNKSASVKLIYVKYLDALARWLNRVIAGDTDRTRVELSGISDDLVARLIDFLCEVKRKYELRKGTPAKKLGAELTWFISKSKRMYNNCRVGDESGSNHAVKEINSSKMTEQLDAVTQECSTPRECPSETLKWLRNVAKDPSTCRESYRSEEPWKQLIQLMASRINTNSACEKSWQKLQKMHPSLYNDSAVPSYNLRERLSFSDGKKAGKEKTDSGKGSTSRTSESDEEDRPWTLVGPEFQAEVPEWTDITSERDMKWLGIQTWPTRKKQNNSIERDPIGKGRQDPCGCENQGSVECVKFHITRKQEKLKLELGPAFYIWCFDIMGEGILRYWKEYECSKINELMTYPPTLSPSFFDQLKTSLAYKSRGKIVSYFYNVILLQFRANQSRITPHEVDSDTDQLYNIATANKDQTPEANTSQKPLMLLLNRKRRR